MPVQPINPPARLLMGPGPINADPRVLRAMSAQLVGQYDPAMTGYMNETMELYRGVFATANEAPLVVDGTSRAGIEAAFVSLIKPGDVVLIPIFGRFGHLLREIAKRCQADVRVIEREWGTVFTAAEIEHLSHISGKSTLEVLTELKAAGLAAMPGGGAEIFADRVRLQIAKRKVSAEKWLEIHRQAHGLGIRTNATMLYGHIETLEERLDHMDRLRNLQDETGGFHSFIPLAFQPDANALAFNLGKTEFTTGIDDLRNLAVSRLYLDNFQHIKGYWVMIGSDLTQVSLDWGVSDVDGTILEEHIAHAAGATSPLGLTTRKMVEMISRGGRVAVERNAYYDELKIYDGLEQAAD
mgnify:CR=1 FL=1